MSSFILRVREQNSAHVRVQLFAGPDPAHRALAGELTLTPDEWRAFESSTPFEIGAPLSPVGPQDKSEQEWHGFKIRTDENMPEGTIGVVRPAKDRDKQ